MKHAAKSTSKRTTKRTANHAKARSMAAAAEAVRKRLGLETLADRGRDALDFHDLSVESIREAIALAFDAGWNAGFEAGSTLAR
ncbi:MAG: hypothetical protein KF678_10945 [Phycisphaeraceae bacterium]|nr:hypothetical protein [Phycisphaeraceae bacterium]